MDRRNFLKKTVAASAGLAMFPSAAVLRTSGLFDDKAQTFTGAERFEQLVKTAQKENWKALPIGQLMGTAGLALLGTPYVANTLELYDDREVCSINLLGLDCVTFFENVLGFARMLKSGKADAEAMMQQITLTRYRRGRLTDYLSRLHYTTDWFFDNERKGVVKMITRTLAGAERFTKRVNFMSTHPERYRQLRANHEFVALIAEIEEQLNERDKYYLPKAKVETAEPLLQTGDIIGITTAIDGIDCSHTGLCYRDEDGELRFLHASSAKEEVVLDDRLSVYLNSIDKHTGIMVARPLEPTTAGK